MTKEELAAAIADIAGGAEERAAESIAEREIQERKVVNATDETLWACIPLGKAIHQFCLDTFKEVVGGVQGGPILSFKQSSLLHWHAVAFSRYYTAFKLFSTGYYAESMMLSRGLWEIALTLVAINQGLRTKRGAIGEFGVPDSALVEIGIPDVAPDTAQKHVTKLFKDTDRDIQDALIYKNANLSDDAKEAVRTFKMLCDAEAHKSKLSLARDISDGVKESRFNPFPRFTKSQAGTSYNVLFLATRCWASTLSYLKPLLAHVGDAWAVRYRQTLATLDQTVMKGPVPMVQGFAEVVSKVFMVA